MGSLPGAASAPNPLRLGFGEYADPDGLAPLGVARECFVAAVVAVAPAVLTDFERGPLRLAGELLAAPLRGQVDSLESAEAWRGVAPAEGIAALRELRARQRARGVATGWVFDRGDGERLHAETFRGWFERAMQDAGVPRLTPHGLRHTGATALARAGVSPKTLAARLGHSSVSTTFDLYAHALVEDQRDAAEAFATRLDRAG